MKKVLALILSIIMSAIPIFSQTSPSAFSVIGVKSQISQSNKELLVITVYLNESIDTESVAEKNIFINDTPLSSAKILFSKRGRSFSFLIHNSKKDFTIRLGSIKNSEGQQTKPIQLHEFSENTFWKFSREANKWQKF